MAYLSYKMDQKIPKTNKRDVSSLFALWSSRACRQRDVSIIRVEFKTLTTAPVIGLVAIFSVSSVFGGPIVKYRYQC